MLKSLCSALIILLATSVGALCADGPYIGISTGLSFYEDSDISVNGSKVAKVVFSPGFLGSGVAGYAFKNGIRLEGEFAYRRADYKEGSGNTSAISGLANFYYDIKTDTTVTPYLGFGLGYGRVEWNPDLGASDNYNALAYQFATGLGVELSKNFLLDIGYRYFGTADNNRKYTYLGSNYDVTALFRTHNVTIGLKYCF